MKFLLNRLMYGVSTAVGILVYLALRGNAFAAEVAIAVAYTVLLAGLLMADPETRSHLGERLEGAALWKGIAFHLAFLAVVMATEWFVRNPLPGTPDWMMARHGRRGPLLWLFATAVIIGACHLERKLLFSGIAEPPAPVDETLQERAQPKGYQVEAKASVTEQAKTSSSPEDEHLAWMRYLSQAQREFRKPGIDVATEHDLWIAARTGIKPKLAAAK